MPAIFTCATGKTYNYVTSPTVQVAQAASVVEFGVQDSKGRAVGMSRVVTFESRSILEEATGRGGWIWPVGAPLQRFAGRAISTRDGKTFGSADVRVYGSTEAEVAAELDKRIERARLAAVKKHA
jgi:hypothetical protein